MFLNGNAIADELPNQIQFSLTTLRDASLPGIQTYFIYSSRIKGKPSLISIKSSVFKANLAYIRHGLLVSRREFPGKTNLKAFKANLAYIRQDLRLRPGTNVES